MTISAMPHRAPMQLQMMSPVERARNLEREAHEAAMQIADDVLLDLERVMVRCSEIGALVAVPPGIRDEMVRLAEHAGPRIDSMKAIRDRA